MIILSSLFSGISNWIYLDVVNFYFASNVNEKWLEINDYHTIQFLFGINWMKIWINIVVEILFQLRAFVILFSDPFLEFQIANLQWRS